MLETIFIPAIVSIVVSLVTIYIKTRFDNKSYKQKLTLDHEESEKKKIKESISSHKILVLNAFEELNYRLWNLSTEFSRGWHHVDGDYNLKDKYYFHSTVYRLASACFWAKKVEENLVFVDTTLAEQNDLDFLKYCKFVSLLMCHARLFRGLNYDDSEPVDHFYRHDFYTELNSLTSEGGELVNYSEFVINLDMYLKNMKGICQFIDSIKPDDGRFRWAKLYCLQLVIVCFLNTFGYDFQKTSKEKIEVIIDNVLKQSSGDVILRLFCNLVRDYKLEKNQSMKDMLDIIDYKI